MTYVPFGFAPFVILLAGLGWLAVDEINRRSLVRQRIERRLGSEEIAKSIRTTRELLAAYALAATPYPYPKETRRDRLALAWEVLRGRITWRDIQ